MRDVLSYRFELRSQVIDGELYLDRPSQTLHYDIHIPANNDRDVLDIKIHRGSAGAKGPVIELLGQEPKGAVAIHNSDLEDLLAGNLHMIIYTRDTPTGSMRGQVQRLETRGSH